MTAAMLLAAALAQPPVEEPAPAADAPQAETPPAITELQTSPADRTREAIEEAMTLAQQEQPEAALEVVLRARESSDDPWLFFMEGALRRRIGDCEGAVRAFNEFLATEPAEEGDREETLAWIEECGGQPEPVAPPPPVTVVPSPVENPPPTQSRRPSRTGVALWAVGGSSLAVGVGLLVASAGVRANALGGDVGLERYLRQERTSRGLGISGVIVATAGTAVLSAALILHLRQRRHAAKHR